MSDEQTAFTVILTLVAITLHNGSDTPRGHVCIAVLWCTVPGYLIYDSDWYYYLRDMLGSYGYQSATPFLAILILSLIRDKLSTILICLFSMLILTNGVFWYLEGNGYHIQTTQQAILWSVFIIEVALMLSPRLTNGIHGVVQRINVARNNPALGYSRNHRTHISPGNSSENTQ